MKKHSDSDFEPRARNFFDWVLTRKDLEALIGRVKQATQDKTAKEMSIDVSKLLYALNQSKKKLERRIANKILLEKDGVKLKFRKASSALKIKKAE